MGKVVNAVTETNHPLPGGKIMIRLKQPLRRGAALIAALVVLAITGLYISEQSRLLMIQRHQANEHALLQQSHMLLCAGLERAKLQQELNARYAGETWQLSTPRSDRDSLNWEIEIKPLPTEDSPERGWLVIARLMREDSPRLLSQMKFLEERE
jgi:hypothetical protein